MSASWLQFAFALVLMFSVVAAAGYWGQRKRARQEAPGQDRQQH